MALRDEFSRLYRQREWKALHGALDAASHSCDTEERCCVAYWRATALEAEDRCLEAIDVLTANRDDFSCKTMVHADIAENLRRLGRDLEAIDELKRAPMDEEMERYHALVVDAKYLLAHLLATNRLDVEPSLLDEIPDNYVHITSRGKRITKTDLLAMIPGASPGCGCMKTR